MKLAVQWAGLSTRIVTTAEELDAVLDSIERGGRPVMVDLSDPERDDPWDDQLLMQIGVGHADRSFVMFDADGAWGLEPTVPLALEPIWFDYGGTPTEYGPSRTRVTPATARQAAREFLEHDGARPTCVQWTALDG